QPVLHPLRVGPVPPMAKQVLIFFQRLSSRGRVDLQRKGKSFVGQRCPGGGDDRAQTQGTVECRQHLAAEVSERNRDLLEKTQMIADAVLAEHGTGMSVMQVEVQ